MTLQPPTYEQAKLSHKPLKRRRMERSLDSAKKPLTGHRIARKQGSAAIPYSTNSLKRPKKKAKRKIPGTKGVQSKFNKIVRERADWICVRCSRDCTERKGLLHASHFWAVGFTATRFDFDNVDALCYPCHFGQLKSGWEYNKQGDYRTFMIKKLGQDGYDALEQKARSQKKLLDAKLEFLSSLQNGETPVSTQIEYDARCKDDFDNGDDDLCSYISGKGGQP